MRKKYRLETNYNHVHYKFKQVPKNSTWTCITSYDTREEAEADLEFYRRTEPNARAGRPLFIWRLTVSES